MLALALLHASYRVRFSDEYCTRIRHFARVLRLTDELLQSAVGKSHFGLIVRSGATASLRRNCSENLLVRLSVGATLFFRLSSSSGILLEWLRRFSELMKPASTEFRKCSTRPTSNSGRAGRSRSYLSGSSRCPCASAKEFESL